MFIIGIDPHRGSHAAVVIDRSEAIQATLELRADRYQRQRLLDWASGFTPRAWAVEGATGTGSLLAQQLVAVGERVIDVVRGCGVSIVVAHRARVRRTLTLQAGLVFANGAAVCSVIYGALFPACHSVSY